jgi:hypothetical protein
MWLPSETEALPCRINFNPPASPPAGHHCTSPDPLGSQGNSIRASTLICPLVRCRHPANDEKVLTNRVPRYAGRLIRNDLFGSCRNDEAAISAQNVAFLFAQVPEE